MNAQAQETITITVAEHASLKSLERIARDTDTHVRALTEERVDEIPSIISGFIGRMQTEICALDEINQPKA